MENKIVMPAEVADWFLKNQDVAKVYIDALGEAGEDPTLFIVGLCQSYAFAESLLPGKGIKFLGKLSEIAHSSSSTKILETARGVVKSTILPEVEPSDNKPHYTTESKASNGRGCLIVLLVVLTSAVTYVATVI